jgi:predicted protein tyrosine phosphatase
MNEFQPGTMNSAIFELTAPYDNPYQGDFPRWLFVCSAGLLRSPTGAALANQRGINARACGSALTYALIPISANLVAWAHKIVFVCSEVRDQSLDSVFRNNHEIREAILSKEVVLDIPDRYRYMQSRLIKHFERELFEPLGYPGHS